MDVENEMDLGRAIDNGEETIKVKGSLAPRIRKIWYMDQILWCLCLACLTAAIAALVLAPATCGISAALTMVAGTPAACFMGMPAASTAVITAAAGSGIMTLKRLRNDYKLEFISSEYIVLHRK
jgi:hypothetical protein